MWKQQRVASTYVVVRVTGSSIARFLNMCRHKRIGFWEISKREDGFEAKITRADFLKLKEICRKTSCKVKIIQKHGIKFLLFRYRKHTSFLIGILIASAMLYVCGLFVWDVSFTGNSEYTDSNLMKYLISKDIHPGILIRDIDCNKIESELRSEYSGITWVSAEISGTRLIVHIKENDGAQESTKDLSGQHDIIATQDGIIRSIITRKGTPLVKPGDSVVKGQILVSGIVNIYNDAKEIASKTYTGADADIMIKSDIHYEDKLDITHQDKVYTGRVKKKELISILNHEVEFGIVFGQFKDADLITDTTVLKLTKNFCLPIKTESKTYLEYEMKSSDYTQEEAQHILASRLNQYLKELVENKVQIVNNSVKMESNSVSYDMQGILTVTAPAYDYADITDTEVEENKEESN